MTAPYIGIHDADGNALLPLLVEPTSDPILVEKFEIDPPAPRSASDPKLQDDGDDDRTKYVGSAAVTIEGTVVGDDVGTPWSYVDQFKRWASPRQRVYLHVKRADWDEPRRILVRGEAPQFNYTDLLPAFQAQWKAPQGLLEAVDAEEAVLFPVDAGTETGLAEPIFEPVSTPPSGGGATVLRIGGSVNCWPVVDLYGPASGAVVLLNSETGLEVRLRDSTVIDAGHFLRIDFAAHTLFVDGDQTLTRFGFLDFANTDWWSLDPGSVDASLTIAHPGAGCHGVLRWRPRWLP